MLTPYPATTADYAALTAIWQRSVLATHDFLQATDRLAIQRALPQYFAQVTLLKWQVGPTIVGLSGTDDTELVMLFLDPAYLRHGYGHQIIQWLIETVGVQTVTVNAQNTGALAFYQRQGFQIVSRAATDGDGRPYPVINLALH
ncbi:GNAT family N-acetyltransferase [Lactiplantibacillus daowaiensis]|uniref:GNAT family N-acetyltransferase n=1 Tax=Lactiplantibacillus daowaiensis TaxID=2559918 RepID=A0ABW1RWP0_9LACO|nr:GNAT family N-acetyltransferase [Lactiplantibacillus daowaiensis]